MSAKSSVSVLSRLFDPDSVAVIGASNRPQRVGNVLMRNLLEGGFSGPIMPVNPKHRAVAGVLGYPDIAALPITPDLGVICTPPLEVPGIVDQLGARGTRAAVVITGNMRRLGPDGRPLLDSMRAAARKWGIRLLGANSLGLMVPKAGLNASFSHVPALPGRIAFVSQSGALCTAVLDWARPKGIGFSHFIALGNCDDIDFGDVLDYLGSDPGTRAILLYIERMDQRRNFVAAARAAARNKPVLAIKAGRMLDELVPLAEGQTHTGALARPDDVFDAVLRRAGVLRVRHIDELFAAVETLARAMPLRGERLAIVCNGGGTGVMALDELVEGGGRLAELAPETMRKLSTLLPVNWSHANPIDIVVDASPRRYADTLRVLGEDKGIDAILALYAPTAISASEDIARAVVKQAREQGLNLLTAWVGEDSVAPARKVFAEAGVPTYDTPARAVRAFQHLVNYNRNQEMLMQTPPSIAAEFAPDTAAARAVVERALAAGHGVLSEPDAKAVLSAYNIPVVPTRIAASAAEAAQVAEEVGFPIALTILSPDIARKWDVGGIALTLESREAVGAAAAAMVTRVRAKRPDARIDGFTIQRMASRFNARQLIMGVTTDPLFGPVILFGEGGRAVEVVRDHAVGLPPLNLPLARDLIGRTRIFKLLQAYYDRPAANLDAICLTLIKISQLIVDIPEIVEMDINPLFADDKGVLVVDAHIRAQAAAHPEGRLAIRPYPQALEEQILLKDGRAVLLRPIRPEDEPAHHDLMARLTPEDIRYRFFNYVRELRHSQMARLTQIDYDREMAFVASLAGPDGAAETLGVVRTVTDPDNDCAEFAVLARSDMKGQGLGRRLMDKMIAYCRARGTRVMRGEVLAENRAMLALARKLGFKASTLPDGDVVAVELELS